MTWVLRNVLKIHKYALNSTTVAPAITSFTQQPIEYLIFILKYFECAFKKIFLGQA